MRHWTSPWTFTTLAPLCIPWWLASFSLFFIKTIATGISSDIRYSNLVFLTIAALRIWPSSHIAAKNFIRRVLSHLKTIAWIWTGSLRIWKVEIGPKDPKEPPFSEMNFSKQLCVSLWIETILRKEKLASVLPSTCKPTPKGHVRGAASRFEFWVPKKRRSIARRASKTTKGAKDRRKFWDMKTNEGSKNLTEQDARMDGTDGRFLNSYCYHESLAVVLWCTSFIDWFTVCERGCFYDMSCMIWLDNLKMTVIVPTSSIHL